MNYAEQLDILKRFLHSQERLMLIIGDRGSGKTDLLDSVASQLRVSRHIIRINANPSFQPSQLVDILSKNLVVKISQPKMRPKMRLETQLTEILDNLNEHNQNCLLIIDDAHALPLTMLAALCFINNVEEGSKVHLHMLLSGKPVLADKISRFQPRQVAKITLDALTRDQTLTKIKKYLGKANVTLPGSVSDAAMEKFHHNHLAARVTTAENQLQQSTPPNANRSQTLTPRILWWKTHRVRAAAILGLALMALAMSWMNHHPLLTHSSEHHSSETNSRRHFHSIINANTENKTSKP